jgi:hypothetical protein
LYELRSGTNVLLRSVIASLHDLGTFQAERMPAVFNALLYCMDSDPAASRLNSFLSFFHSFLSPSSHKTNPASTQNVSNQVFTNMSEIEKEQQVPMGEAVSLIV